VVFADESWCFKLTKESQFCDSDVCLGVDRSGNAIKFYEKKKERRWNSFSVSLLTQRVSLRSGKKKSAYKIVENGDEEDVILLSNGANRFESEKNAVFVQIWDDCISFKSKHQCDHSNNKKSNVFSSAHIIPFNYRDNKTWIMLGEESVEAVKGWNEGTLTLFGGKRDNCETADSTCKREFEEETYLVDSTGVQKLFEDYNLEKADQDSNPSKQHCVYITWRVYNGLTNANCCKITKKLLGGLAKEDTDGKYTEKCGVMLVELESLLKNCFKEQWDTFEWDDNSESISLSLEQVTVCGDEIHKPKTISSFALYVILHLAQKKYFKTHDE